MRKLIFTFLLSLFTIVTFARIANFTRSVQFRQEAYPNEPENEQSEEIVANDKEFSAEDQLVHPKEYYPISTFLFHELPVCGCFMEQFLQLSPPHYQVPKRPPKEKMIKNTN